MLDSFLSMNGLRDEDLLNFERELTPAQIKKGSLFITYGQIIRHIALVEDGFL
jgi:hypothetical protein